VSGTPFSWRLACFDTLPSTSDHCIARAEAGEPEGLAVLARSQTSPRGSRGRAWQEASGTLALSVLLRPADGPNPAVIWPFLAALAFHDALGLTPAHREAIRLKWPNDLTLGQRKLGGILVERGVLPEGGWLVIGFGANLAAAPDLADRGTACLAELGRVPAVEGIAQRLLESLSLWMIEAAAGGFARIRREWLGRAHPPGTELAVRGPDRQTTGGQTNAGQTNAGQTTGRFSSIAEDGALLLAIGDEVRRISTGEILFPPEPRQP
jgi:BirA family transcriptional regulator, biotin operon repressor / biotin---[acetyl-CoA-carboxylase] ligase